MPYDGIFTRSIVNEMQKVIDSRIDKIYQPSNEEIILQFKKNKETIKILLSANPSCARAHITKSSFENPKTAPNFCMILRKSISGGRILSIEQQELDRIIKIKIESQDELGYAVPFILLIEIMGKRSNIVLINKDNIIVDSIKHIHSDVNRYRQIIPGVPYINPPNSDKINPLSISNDALHDMLNNDENISTGNFFIKNFLGISKIFSKQVCGLNYNKTISELSTFEINEIVSNFFYNTLKIRNNDYQYILYYRNNSIADFYVLSLNEYSDCKAIHHDSPGQMMDLYFSQKDVKNTLKQKYNSIFKLVNNLIDRNRKKLEIYTSKINECKNYSIFKEYGDILIANQYSLNKGLDEVTLENFYDNNNPIKISLDNSKSIVENATDYYKKYSKYKSTCEMVNNQLQESLSEKDYLESITVNLENASDIETIEEIKNELAESGYIKHRRQKNIKSNHKSQPHHFISSDGYDIYVGKNNYQNDYLTTKFAVSSDIWMHTKDIPGSHVIIKSKNGHVSDKTLLEGAQLSAYFSKGKNSSSVAVDYTEKKNVKKPSGAKPGKVIYYTNRTIYVTPEEEKVNLIIKKDDH